MVAFRAWVERDAMAADAGVARLDHASRMEVAESMAYRFAQQHTRSSPRVVLRTRRRLVR